MENRCASCGDWLGMVTWLSRALWVFTADLAASVDHGFSFSALLTLGVGPFFVVGGVCPVHCLAASMASAH